MLWLATADVSEPIDEVVGVLWAPQGAFQEGLNFAQGAVECLCCGCHVMVDAGSGVGGAIRVDLESGLNVLNLRFVVALRLQVFSGDVECTWAACLITLAVAHKGRIVETVGFCYH